MRAIDFAILSKAMKMRRITTDPLVSSSIGKTIPCAIRVIFIRIVDDKSVVF